MNNIVSYTHKPSKRAKNLTIKIESDGSVIVISPRFVLKRQIDKFVQNKQEWILSSLAKIKSQKKINSDTEIMVFGKKYDLIKTNNIDTLPGVILEKSNFITNTWKTNTKNKHNQQIITFLRNTAEKYIIPRTHQMGKHMDITFGKITLREQKTRWGSCSSRGNLNFNWRLIHHPTKIIDYVIIHELAHRTHLNHSAKFWKLVEKFDPEYRIHTGWLKRQKYH